ncbi:MAG: Fe-S cluster assembly ATPase SufC [Firmicutes bacterium]|nr:Fe-S cluster assembly ATPase SufC [Bacillota bacterium]
MHTLKIKDLFVSIDNKLILKGLNLEIKSGEIHAIMGPNGTGKSTLSKVIMGDPNYKIEKGSICFDDIEINDLSVDKRANLGLFLGMQLPLEIPGVTNADLLRTALSIKEGNNFSLMPFIKKMDKTVEKLKMDKSMIHRGINQGFSGGERKKNEILQMYMLKPTTILLDEIDSGLDVDSLKIVGTNVMDYFNEKKPGILLITHYQRLLEYITPNFIHIMIDGKIVKSGDYSLVNEIEKNGYENILNDSTNIIEEKEVYE